MVDGIAATVKARTAVGKHDIKARTGFAATEAHGRDRA
jgi:hypothetical protein